MPFIEALTKGLWSKFGKFYDIDTRDRYLAMLKNACREIYIVAGLLQPGFYCTTEFIEVMKEKHPYTRLNILYHKQGEESPEKALETLQQQYRDFLELLVDRHSRLPDDKKDRTRLFWSERMPLNHFCIADNALYVEKEHEPNKQRSTWVFENCPAKIQEKYIEFFNGLVSQPFVHRLSLEECVVTK
jgi:hypothetical protein